MNTSPFLSQLGTALQRPGGDLGGGGEGQCREKGKLGGPEPQVLQTHTQALTWVFQPLAQPHRPPSSYQRHFTPLYTALLQGWKHMKRRRRLARLQ